MKPESKFPTKLYSSIALPFSFENKAKTHPKMKVKILAFGIAREICGARSFELDLPESCDTVSLQQLLSDQYPRLQELSSCRLALNEEYLETNKILASGDEIAILPPVSGG